MIENSCVQRLKSMVQLQSKQRASRPIIMESENYEYDY